MKNGEQPAYPIYTTNGEGQITDRSDDGLTKREYFAAMAMQGLLTVYLSNSSNVKKSLGNPSGFAEISVECADALLAEFDKPIG